MFYDPKHNPSFILIDPARTADDYEDYEVADFVDWMYDSLLRAVKDHADPNWIKVTQALAERASNNLRNIS